jgi:hypothetical protein
MASKFAPVKHPFLYDIFMPNGERRQKERMARVIKATTIVDIVLDKPHVLESMRLNGVGNTQTCSAAICTYAHAASFTEHEVVGITDFTPTRAFIGSKMFNDVPAPSLCYAYEHNDSGQHADGTITRHITRLNDSVGGQVKLLALIRAHGPLTIRFWPYRQRSKEKRSGRDRRGTGVRSFQRRGARLRYFKAASAGALPIKKEEELT